MGQMCRFFRFDPDQVKAMFGLGQLAIEPFKDFLNVSETSTDLGIILENHNTDSHRFGNVWHVPAQLTAFRSRVVTSWSSIVFGLLAGDDVVRRHKELVSVPLRLHQLIRRLRFKLLQANPEDVPNLADAGA